MFVVLLCYCPLYFFEIESLTDPEVHQLNTSELLVGVSSILGL